tara:strand:- start:17 stop:475 length:459 start_codon:yes stop_codon:yes gene_type:complete
MASSTLVNDLSSSSVGCSSKRIVETYKVKDGVTVLAGQWVALDVAAAGVEASRTVLIATQSVASNIPVGVALTGGVGVASGSVTIEVIIAGYAAAAYCNTGVAAGAPIMSGAAGKPVAYLGTGLTSTVQPCGYTLKLAAANLADVIVTCSPI